ncbi:GatB/YqeY domain-containing protein, partial [Parvibaculum sp.]|uniref:GatB/YqeY domain-containing protein n=1 Tax=Parvibaculum sp. TaxID=2024848 RepID=UPI0032EB08C6
MTQSLRESIKQGLTEATKAQDKRRMATLRLIMAALKDRDIAGRTDGRDAGVSDAEILDVLSK